MVDHLPNPRHKEARVAVIGDIGGYRKPFYGLLRKLGIKTSTNHIPNDLIIVQIGDLIGAAPEPSAEILQVVRSLRRRNPGQWIQLMGNWEARYHPHGTWFRALRQGNSPDLAQGHATLLNTLWSEDDTGPAAVLESPNMAPVLITHAGVTRRFLDSLGQLNETDPHVVAAAINRAIREPAQRDFVYAPGDMFAGSTNDPNPGPLWASPRELWRSWNETPMPFDQIVGHAAPYMFNKECWYDNQPIPETEWATPIPNKRMTYWRPPHSKHGIAHIDPAVTRKSPAEHLHAHYFPNAKVTVPKPAPNHLPDAQGQYFADGVDASCMPDILTNLIARNGTTPQELALASGVPYVDLIGYMNKQDVPTIATLQTLTETVGAKLIVAFTTTD